MPCIRARRMRTAIMSRIRAVLASAHRCLVLLVCPRQLARATRQRWGATCREHANHVDGRECDDQHEDRKVNKHFMMPRARKGCHPRSRQAWARLEPVGSRDCSRRRPSSAASCCAAVLAIV